MKASPDAYLTTSGIPYKTAFSTIQRSMVQMQKMRCSSLLLLRHAHNPPVQKPGVIMICSVTHCPRFAADSRMDLNSYVILVNGNSASKRSKLADGDTVVLMSPVAGG